jgi:hypothetical protein
MSATRSLHHLALAAAVFSTLGCARERPAASSAAALAPRDDMRTRIEQAIEREVASLRGREEVSSYLESLRARATAQRRVTALEVEPGVAAIERLAPSIGSEAAAEWVRSFRQSMAGLSASYRPVS